ncbi:Gldg family protein [Nitrosococcus oceani]|uniref:Gldg family protein n=1 Tax=Nitrosococcus oceani TaxID=1229 RepID=UPI0004E9800C|nr:Gldg family protein [Nitrosococcus oceani]KFI22178.1 ABC transporter permease [Nitrosococcus oceani]
MGNVLRIARKEFAGFFSSPTAFIFLGAFLAVILFIFFWVETFFARNIADVRPLFEWMPLLLIFLVAAITMRMWSEERRTGTLEFLLATPVKSYQFVLGKFLACLGLVAVALLLTLPLPLTVSFLGPLDWGPVLGGYLATLFLAAAYGAIGLFVSARSPNQIVSLILTTVVCGFFYLLGSDALTGLFGNRVSEFLQLLGSGSRFDSITRGVIDLRDLYYYLSLVGVFLTLNVFALEWLRWAGNPTNATHRRWGLITGLFAANFLAANLWLAPLGGVRADVTEGNVYSISEATRGYLAQLREPMLIRGYFSAQTHPLLAPLVPRLRDLLEEYAVAGEGRLRVEFIDPREHPELEREANEKYGIKPVPFQFASKYQSSVVNSYFDILIQYGDQHQVLDFQDLIEVKAQSQNDLSVDLGNPEYDLTQAIKKVLYAYQSAGNLFGNIPYPVRFKGYISGNEKLPEVLQTLRQDLDTVLNELQRESGGKLTVDIRDPDADGGALAQQIESEFGFRPMAASLLDSNTFWFYMTLEGGERIIQVPLPEEFKKAGLERSLNAALKRFSQGFLKTVALHTPPATPSLPQFGMMGGGGKRFNLLRDTLAEEHNVITADLKDGQVPLDADLLLLAAPETLDEKQLFAVDQFLMRGGTVVMATAPFTVDTQQALAAKPHSSGLKDWLAHQGLVFEEQMVLDPQNAAFPIPVDRNIGGFVVQETQLVDYPYFVDIRSDGMPQDNGITAGLNQVTLTWASPITVDAQKNEKREVTPLLESSEQSWTSDSLNIQPDFRAHGQLGFPVGENPGRQLLGVAVEGRFDSFFKNKPSPLMAAEEEPDAAKEESAAGTQKNEAQSEEKPEPVIARVIERSPESARIILFGSNSFLSDEMLDLAAAGLGTRYLKPVELAENAIDWSLEDRGLLAIRGRAQFSRTLYPLEREAQVFWEYLNYGLALLGLLLVWLFRRRANRQAQQRYAEILSETR